MTKYHKLFWIFKWLFAFHPSVLEEMLHYRGWPKIEGHEKIEKILSDEWEDWWKVSDSLPSEERERIRLKD